MLLPSLLPEHSFWPYLRAFWECTAPRTVCFTETRQVGCLPTIWLRVTEMGLEWLRQSWDVWPTLAEPSGGRAAVPRHRPPRQLGPVARGRQEAATPFCFPSVAAASPVTGTHIWQLLTSLGICSDSPLAQKPHTYNVSLR